MSLCARKFTPHEDTELIRIIESAPTKKEGYRRAAQLLGRTVYSIQARYRRLRRHRREAESSQDATGNVSATANTEHSITDLLEHLVSEAEAIVIQTPAYECRIVRTKDHSHRDRLAQAITG